MLSSKFCNAEVVLVLASCSSHWIALAPFKCSQIGRAKESLSSDFARRSLCLVCVGFVRIPSLWICHEGSALIFRFRLDWSLQSTYHWCTGSDRSETCQPIAKYTNMGHNWICCSQATGFRSVCIEKWSIVEWMSSLQHNDAIIERAKRLAER